MIKDVTVEAVSKYGILSDGKWLNVQKGFDLSQFRKGQSYKINMAKDEKKRDVITAIVEADSVAGEPAQQQPEQPKATVSSTSKSYSGKPMAYGREMSAYELEKDKRIGVQGIVQSIVLSPLTPAFVLKAEDLAPYVEKRAKELLAVTQNLVKESN